MAVEKHSGMGAVELASIAVVGVFGVVVLFWVFSALAGAVWWLVKTVVLVAVLFLVVRWAFRRVAR